MKKILSSFSKVELLLWSSSVCLIVIFFCVFDRMHCLSLCASLIGVTSLIFIAKGNPIGQGLTIVFALLYGAISFSFSYYGEMITYLGMTAPMAVLSLVSWLKNPYGGNKSQVKINDRISKWEIICLIFFTCVTTVLFYFILSLLKTANIHLSTISVATSFIAVYLTFYRSPFYALAYALNDIVLIVLWTMAMFSDITYLSVVICFAVFLVNDIYGFISWRKMAVKQSKGD